MFPIFNASPFQSNGATSSSAPQQATRNPGNFVPQLMRIPPQMGIFNPQTTIPSCNSNGQSFPFQAPQVFAMNQTNNISTPQPMPQIFTQNSLIPSQFLNQNFNLGFPNQLQSMNQLFLSQIPNLNSQALHGNFNLPQNLASFVGKTQLGCGNSSGVMQHSGNPVALNQTPKASQQLQGAQGFVSIPSQPNLNSVRPLPMKPQGNHRNPTGNHKIHNNGKNPQQKNFLRNSKREVSHSRSTKSQFHNVPNTNGNFRSSRMQLRKGNHNNEGRKTFTDCAKHAQHQKQRLIPLNYTEQEVQQWREERKKNYPSKANIEKKLAQKLQEPGVSDKVAELRRQQLKEILKKQAELGCEVAEIPACYLSDSEQQAHSREENGRTYNKKEKFQKKFNKRGRFNQNVNFVRKKDSSNRDSSATCGQNDRSPKKQRLTTDDSVHGGSKREATLLQKLLSVDIRRDKHHLLQAFRFMVLNAFFKDWPEKPLKFPVVVVRETGDEGEVIMKGKSNGDGLSGETGELIDDDGHYNNNQEKPDGEDQMVDSAKEKSCLDGRETREEEGEIIY